MRIINKNIKCIYVCGYKSFLHSECRDLETSRSKKKSNVDKMIIASGPYTIYLQVNHFIYLFSSMIGQFFQSSCASWSTSLITHF